MITRAGREQRQKHSAHLCPHLCHVLTAGPGFAAVALLSLALGIGANTAIFSLWNSVLYDPLPGVRHPEQLVILSNPDTAGGWFGSAPGNRNWLAYTEFEQLRDHAGSFSAMMASQSALDRWPVRIEGGEWEEASGRLVSDGYFQFLGVNPELGRGFTAGDDRAGSPSAVISYSYWQRRFGGRVNVLGKAVTVGGAVLTVIGVAPRGFAGETAAQQPDLWIPLGLQPSVLPGEDRLREVPPQKSMWLHVFGRLKPGVTAARAEAEANAVFAAGLKSCYGAMASPDRRPELLDQHLKIRLGAQGASAIRSDFRTSLTGLLAAVGLLLLIACANLANLLLARGATRRPEMALRLSLGASRGRLIRQLITENLVLASLGGLAGLATARLVHGALVRMIVLSDENFQMSFALEPRVLAFTVAATVGAAMLFGLLPAWQVVRTAAGTSLKEQSRGGGPLARVSWTRSLISLQLALSLPLLVGAGLLARTLYNLQHIELGFPAERLQLVRIDLRKTGSDTARHASLLREWSGRVTSPH